MSDTPAMPTSLDDIALAVAEDGPSPVPPMLQAPVTKSASKKPATAKMVKAESQAPVDSMAAEPAAAIITQPADTAERSAKENKMADTIQAMTDKTKTLFADANERAKAQLEKGTKAFEDINSFNKGNIEAIVESSKIAASGMQKMGQDVAVYAKSSYEHATTAMKSMTSVKSPTELFKLQGEFARTAFDAWMAEASRSTEAALKLAGAIAQPISNRVAIAAEKIKVAA